MTELQPNTQITPETVGLYDRAVMFATRDKPSTSYLQRRLQIGYSQAVALIERMQGEGLISSPNSAGKCEILVPYTDRPAASSPSAVGVGSCGGDHQPGCDCAVPEEDVARSKPPIRDAVDWSVVGPKLAEEVREALAGVAYAPGDHPIVPIKHDAFVKRIDAALAAATPGGK